MNPPPIPKPGNQKSLPQQAALASLLAPLLAILVTTASRAATQGSQTPPRAVLLITGGVCALLILTGFVLAIVALCTIPRHGRKGILGRGIAGLIVNSLMVLLGAFAFAGGMQRGMKSRQTTRELENTVQDMQTSLRQSYDPEQGITNLGAGVDQLDRLGNQMQDASQNLTGEEAVVMQTMANYLKQLQVVAKKYETTGEKFQAAEVLNAGTLTNKSQIEPRREIVRQLLSANAELKRAIMDSEKVIRSELAKVRIAPATIENVIKGFNSKAAPRHSLIRRIRDCDQRIGDATLGALDLFETQWRKWSYEPTANELAFESDEANEAYGEFLDQINTASEEQIKLQGQLLMVQ